MDERYEKWLHAQGVNERTMANQFSHIRRIEAAYGDIDKHYNQNRFGFLMSELSYDLARGGNASRIVINGDFSSGLSTLRSALNKYDLFRRSLESFDLEELDSTSGVSPSSEAPSLVESEATFSVERDLQAALRCAITQLEPGLTIIDGGAERRVPSGRIDILARDASGVLVVIELKVVKAPRDAVAQILAYMGDLQEEEGGELRGILVAPDYDPRAVSAARMVPALKLVTYGFSFSFTPLG